MMIRKNEFICAIALLLWAPALALAGPPAPGPVAPAPPAVAAPPAAPAAVLIPTALVPQIVQAVLHPHNYDAGDILALVQQLDACAQMQAKVGVVMDTGHCPPVTEALHAQAAALTTAVDAAKAQQQADDAKAKAAPDKH